jgi:hypothetical protein
MRPVVPLYGYFVLGPGIRDRVGLLYQSPVGVNVKCKKIEITISLPNRGISHHDISPHPVTIIQVFLAKYLLHLFLLSEYNEMVDSNHECCK